MWEENYNEYLEKYSKHLGITREEAEQHAIIKIAKQSYEEEEKKAHENHNRRL